MILQRVVVVTLLAVAGASCPKASVASQSSPVPVLVVTHPTAAFLNSLAGLIERGQLPPVQLRFLLHRRERKLRRALNRAVKKHNLEGVSFLILEGVPQNLQIPASGEERRRLGFSSRRLEPHQGYAIPAQWQKMFVAATAGSDGVVVPGGSNIPAALYGERQLAEAVSATPLRSLYELAYLRYLLVGQKAWLGQKPDYLVLGVCYGMQALNVALGGTLVQSIPTEIYGVRHAEDLVAGDPDRMHRNYHLSLRPSTKRKIYRGWFHRLRIDQSTPFFRREGGVYILSNHVQAVKNPASELEIVGYSSDGRVPELARHRKYRNVLALQGHPERDFAWRRLDRLPAATRRFHNKLWRETTRVLIDNATKRLQAR